MRKLERGKQETGITDPQGERFAYVRSLQGVSYKEIGS